MKEAERELKEAVESFDENAPKNPHEKEIRKVRSGFLDHPRIQRLMNAVLRGE